MKKSAKMMQATSDSPNPPGMLPHYSIALQGSDSGEFPPHNEGFRFFFAPFFGQAKVGKDIPFRSFPLHSLWQRRLVV